MDRHDGLPKFDPKKLHGVVCNPLGTSGNFFESNLGVPYCFSSCLSIMTVRFVTSSHKNVCPLLIVKSEFVGYNVQNAAHPKNVLWRNNISASHSQNLTGMFLHNSVR